MSTTSSSASNSFPQMAKVTAAYLPSQMQRNIQGTAKEPKTIPTQGKTSTQGEDQHRRTSHHWPPGVSFSLSTHLNSLQLDLLLYNNQDISSLETCKYKKYPGSPKTIPTQGNTSTGGHLIIGHLASASLAPSTHLNSTTQFLNFPRLPPSPPLCTKCSAGNCGAGRR